MPPRRVALRPGRRRRLALGVGVAELARAVGVSRVLIWRAESRRQGLQAEELVGVARALGVPIQTLFEARERTGPPPRPVESASSSTTSWR
ncbi:MAG: helix-turn-helix domain-containing protein [Candidatus Limnocylindria bacterium]